MKIPRISPDAVLHSRMEARTGPEVAYGLI